MMRAKILFRLIGVCSIATGMALLGCSGDTGGSGDPDFAGENFVASDSAAGSIRLSVTTTRLPVSGTSGFFVTVRDANGAGVGQVQIACDTENGLALISPNTGFELTDSTGSMSGLVGCEVPGSFQMVCRLPIGGNKRQFATIVCEGEIPAGFSGFQDAGGGSLGGTDEVPNDGTTGAGDIRVTAVEIEPAVGSASDSADTRQAICDPDDDNPCEPFGDDFIKFSFENNGNQVVNIDSYSFSVPNASGSGTSTFSSATIVVDAEVQPNGGTADVSALFLESVTGTDATICPAEKRFPNSGSTIPADLGFRNVTFTITASNESGDSFTLTARTSISFDDFDNC